MGFTNAGLGWGWPNPTIFPTISDHDWPIQPAYGTSIGPALNFDISATIPFLSCASRGPRLKETFPITQQAALARSLEELHIIFSFPAYPPCHLQEGAWTPCSLPGSPGPVLCCLFCHLHENLTLVLQVKIGTFLPSLPCTKSCKICPQFSGGPVAGLSTMRQMQQGPQFQPDVCEGWHKWQRWSWPGDFGNNFGRVLPLLLSYGLRE